MTTNLSPSEDKPGRRYKHNQRPYVVVLFSCPEQYQATLMGTENGERIMVHGEARPTEAEAEASAWEALRVWALAGRVPA